MDETCLIEVVRQQLAGGRELVLVRRVLTYKNALTIDLCRVPGGRFGLSGGAVIWKDAGGRERVARSHLGEEGRKTSLGGQSRGQFCGIHWHG